MAPTQTLGVPQLDALLGPVTPGSTILFSSEPGVESDPFLFQVAHHHLAQGAPVVYLAANRSPPQIVAEMKGFGFPDAGIRFIDAYSALLGTKADAAYHVADPKKLKEVVAALERAARDHPGAVLILDSLSSLIDLTSVDALVAAAEPLRAALSRYRLAVCLFTAWPYGDATSPLLAGFDAVVQLRGVQERILFSQYFSLERSAWRPKVDRKPRLYKSIKPGGVVVYIPKILVTGPEDAGKSTFVHSVSDTSRSADRLGTTVAMDHGHLTMEGLSADVFGTPGQSRFDPLLRTLAEQALGVVLVVDSTRPDSYVRAKEMLMKTWNEGLPALVAANKQDRPGALTPPEVAKALQPPENVAVVPCTATDRDSTRTVLKQLLQKILGPEVLA